MKPVLLITLDFPPAVGGVASYLQNLVETFPIGGATVLAPHANGVHDRDMLLHAPIWRRRLLSRFIRPRWLPCFYWSDWVTRKENPRHILVSHLLPVGEIARKTKRRRGVPYSVIAHGYDLGLALTGSQSKRERAERVLRDADHVIVNSKYTAGLATAFGVPEEKIIIIRPSPHFPLTTKVSVMEIHDTKKAYNLANKFVILSVGRMVKRKGFDNVIRALALLKDETPEPKLILVGDGPERENLEKLADELGVADKVLFAGEVSGDEIKKLFASSNVFAMTPQSLGPDVEGFGIVYLEANLFSKPVIGSRSGGVPDAVRHEETGLLVDPNNPEQLADSMRRLRDDRELAAKLGERGRARVLGEFGWARQARPLIEELFPEIE